MIDSPLQPILGTLEDLALIRVSGLDAAEFLQGQLSNDVHRVSPEQSQLTSLNTPQGRTLALMRLFEFDKALLLSLPKALQSPVAKRLRQYVLRSRVEIEPCDDGVARLGLAGETAEAALDAAGIVPPKVVDQVHAQPGLVVVRIAGNTDSRFELHGYKDDIAALRDSLTAHCKPAGPDTWHLLDTLAGIPLLGPETSGEFLPQMLNLDELGAISFQKGCYTGQEIIARAHYRGQVKRRLKLVFRSESARPGETVLAGENTSAVVIQCAPHPSRGFAILAVAPISISDSRPPLT